MEKAQSRAPGPRWESPGGEWYRCTEAGGLDKCPLGPCWPCPPTRPAHGSSSQAELTEALACGRASPAAVVARLSLQQPSSLR